MEWFSLLLCLVTVILLGLYALVKWCLTYWRRHGINYVQPEFPWGNAKKFFKGELSLGDQVTKFYEEFKSKGQVGGGVYFSTNPVYIPVSLELIGNIMQNYFSHFMSHGFYVNEEDDPLSANLFALEDERWKYLRSKLTPTFTSGKLKIMFETMSACSEDLINVLRDHTLIADPVDIKDVVSRFTTDVIGRCAFGIECNSLKNPQSEFRQYGKRIFDPKGLEKIKFLFLFFVPHKLLKALHVVQTERNVSKFFIGIVRDTVSYREDNNIHRNDFMHLVLQLKNRGKLSDNEAFDIKGSELPPDSEKKITFNELAAQCFLFFAAGFETSASTMNFALLELAMNQEIQERLRQEIETVLKKYEEKVSYEAIMEMKYLNMIVLETLRKHPPFPILPRRCNKAYEIPKTKMVIEPGIFVNIPVQSIQRDPEYYPNPEKFDPERFNEENKSQRPAFTFLSFGDGPRSCIASRFGLLQTKIGILAIIKNFKVTLNSKTKTPIRYITGRIVTTIDGDVWLNVSQLK